MADDIQARATKGEEMINCRKRLTRRWQSAALRRAPTLTPARRGMFPPKLDQEIFSHKAGDVFRSEDGNRLS